MAASDKRSEAIAGIFAERSGTRVIGARAVAGGDVNDAFRLETTDGPVFVKTSAQAPAGMYRQEASGLRWLAETGAVAVPEVVLVQDPEDEDEDEGRAEAGSNAGGPRFLALAWVDTGSPGRESETNLGQGLAAMHAAGASSFGATPGESHAPMQFGPVVLPNQPLPTFAEFYGQRRIAPLAELGHQQGRLSATDVAALHRLIDRLPKLAGPPELPARTHGDLWAGNVITDARSRPVLIDPAAHGGHREVDLAALRLFGGPSEQCFSAYAEAWPLADGHAERVALWQLGMVLLHVVLFGGGYASQAMEIARRYG